MSNGKQFGFSGFKLNKPTSSGSHQVPPPQPSQPALVDTGGRPSYAPTFSRKHKTEESYFENDEEDMPINAVDLDYLPGPNSPAGKKQQDDEEDEDELDAFMASIEKKAKSDLDNIGKKTSGGKVPDKGIREDLEKADEQEEFFKWMEENPNAGVALGENDEDEELEYDHDGNIIVPDKNKFIDPLPPIDHTTIEYESFEKNFYHEHKDIAALSTAETEELRRKIGIKVSGLNPPKPVCSFAHFQFDEELMKAIRKSEYTQPTPIQSQAIPAALSGRDIIGIAKTGSGKTAAFIWPAIVHILDQKELEPGDGPIALILAPTRELAQQIYTEAKKFGKVYNISCACAYGGGSLYEQTLACQAGVELLVCTPGRLIDLIKKKGTNLHRVTFLVLDEADRMFDMGFEPQVRSIANHVRPNRQTLLFSATFKKRVEKLAREILIDPIRIIQGELGEANENITQFIKVFAEGPAKWQWVNSKLVELTSAGKVLIFVTKKANAAELAKNLEENVFKVGLLHGDMHQDDRNKIINDYKKGDLPILVATDVAARGLDIPSIKTVINYDVARDIDTHTHRIGRTGRAGEKGVAYTLVTVKDKEFLPHLVRNLESTNQQVPDELVELAMQVPWFKSQRAKHGGGGGGGFGAGGGGGSGKGSGSGSGGGGSGGGGGKFMRRERPGFGFKSTPTGNSAAIQKGPTFNTGPGTDRASALKQAYASQYKSHFVSASSSQSQPASDKRDARSQEDTDQNKKKSRWN